MGIEKTAEYTGKDVSYYLVDIASPKRLEPYTAECEDIIEALGMTFAEGCAFKAVWRKSAARTLGVAKAGYKGGLYDAEKAQYYGARMVAHENRAAVVDGAALEPAAEIDEERSIIVASSHGDGEHYDDMSNPANWLPGDLLEPSPFLSGHCGSPAKFVRPLNDLSVSDKLAVEFPDGTLGLFSARKFKWLTRPVAGNPEAVVCANTSACSACFQLVKQGVRHICQ